MNSTFAESGHHQPSEHGEGRFETSSTADADEVDGAVSNGFSPAVSELKVSLLHVTSL